MQGAGTRTRTGFCAPHSGGGGDQCQCVGGEGGHRHQSQQAAVTVRNTDNTSLLQIGVNERGRRAFRILRPTIAWTRLELQLN